MKTRLLIDGDLLVWRTAAAATVRAFDGTLTFNPHFIEDYLMKLIDYVKERLYVKEIVVAISDKPTFRHEVFPEYKQHRQKRETPPGLEYTYEVLTQKLKLDVLRLPSLEADDVIGLLSREPEYKNIICSIDKDLDQLVGFHYNWVKDLYYAIDNYVAHRKLYVQVLAGDPADNFKGLPQVGRKRAGNIVDAIEREYKVDMEDIDAWLKLLAEQYIARGMSMIDFYTNWVCAYILRQPDEYDFATCTVTSKYYRRLQALHIIGKEVGDDAEQI